MYKPLSNSLIVLLIIVNLNVNAQVKPGADVFIVRKIKTKSEAPQRLYVFKNTYIPLPVKFVNKENVKPLVVSNNAEILETDSMVYVFTDALKKVQVDVYDDQDEPVRSYTTLARQQPQIWAGGQNGGAILDITAFIGLPVRVKMNINGRIYNQRVVGFTFMYVNQNSEVITRKVEGNHFPVEDRKLIDALPQGSKIIILNVQFMYSGHVAWIDGKTEFVKL